MPEDPDKQTPPHQEPPISKSAGDQQDPLEQDLWDLDDPELDSLDHSVPIQQEPMNLTAKSVSINPREFKPEFIGDDEEEGMGEISKLERRSQTGKSNARTGVANLRPRPIDTFDELDAAPEATGRTENPPEANHPPSPEIIEKEEIARDIVPADDFSKDIELPAFEEVDDADQDADTAQAEEKKLRIPFSKKDLIGLGAFVIVALVVLIGILVSSVSTLRFKKDPDLKVRVPIVGSILTISKAEPYWREPKRSGPSIDLAKREAILIPALQISLSEKSGSGALRILFRSSEGETIGDPVIKTFANGRFSTGETTEFAGTDGFTEQSQFPAYRNEKELIWKAELFEATSADADAQHFKKIAEIPLLPYLK